MQSRRSFLKSLFVGGAAMSLIGFPLKSKAANKHVKITILHTNDTHSRVDPFPADDTKNPGQGGFARRAAIVKEIRQKENNILLFDAGDIYQGSPYFNFYGGELELKLMSLMGYDAATIGNHEFDNGIDGIVSQLHNAKFPFINSNYDFSGTALNGKVLPYKIFIKEGIQVGVFGLGVELAGLVDKRNYGNIIYLNPYHKAAEMAHKLKKEMKCDLVICLSHLGYDSDVKKPCDRDLAKQSKNIDLIIGGHSHTFLDKPIRMRNSDNQEILIAQVGYGGVRLGRIDFYFNRYKEKKIVEASIIKILNNQV